MSDSTSPPRSVAVLVPAGMLGAGFDPVTVERGLRLGADVIAIDAGSTDSGPHYLGAAEPKTADGAVRRDLRILLHAAHEGGIPLIVGSCGTSGTDSGVQRVSGIVREICAQDGLRLAVSEIYSEQSPADLIARLDAGRIQPLAPLGPLDAATIGRCSHIVGMMGHEPIAHAIAAGAQVVLAGRATDTALAAAVPLMRGMPAGPTWHAAKVVECGGQCTTNPRAGGVLARIDEDGFTIEPLDPEAECTPTSVAAHMLYETANPFTMREPAGTLQVGDARYTAVDHRTVRVQGSRFEPADQHTIKLEGSAVTGYETMSFVGIRDPRILASIDEWAALLRKLLAERVESTLGLAESAWQADLRLYGHNAILDELERETTAPREVGVMLLVSASTQELATAISKVANPLLLHLPLPDMAYLPSLAFAFSPAHIDRGASYEFVLNHVVEVDDPLELFHIDIDLPEAS
ncbi:acyclic terpene utilization AtuA family protein [Actinospica sp. MGRD01-02]|uniref:Acyclic terpene utilization AtuA family protein n=2 Tax=Actinospica acidithermotolerans TaxID=2828514 RepID=A0A941IGX1_9ACTN|nr:acyclic terpene utilization AtuA family protein [Actinospica acidithermotolerans]MBR7825102.1 acyclic terpene utilization AtuA family protein [Actinospica acidithermotolerans]